MRAKRLFIISGVSGSGKSTALNALEDMGYFCVDNLPSPLIGQFVDFLISAPASDDLKQSSIEDESCSGSCSVNGETQFALLVNSRGENFFPVVSDSIKRLSAAGVDVRLFYFDCQDEIVLRRFRETRRPHPLLISGHTVATIAEALAKERELLGDFRAAATRVFDTSAYTVHDLRREIESVLGHERKLRVEIMSFGFKYGVPHDADLTIDVRFLPNPHFVTGLRELTGEDPEVNEYVFQTGEADEFLDQYSTLLDFLIPRYHTEGKRYLTLGIGCTGGRHRSVALTLCLARRLEEAGLNVVVRHRDIDRVR